MTLLNWLMDFMGDFKTWLPPLAAATVVYLFIDERRKKKLEIQKLQEELRRLKEEPSRLYEPTAKEVDEILEKLRPFSVRIRRLIGADTAFQEFAPRLYEFIGAFVSQVPPPDAEPILQDWGEVRGEAMRKLGATTVEQIDFFLRMAVRAKQFKSADTALDLNAYRHRNEQLIEAVNGNQVEWVASLLHDGANADGNADVDEVPLISAARNGSAAVCEALLSAGADPNRCAGQRRTALMVAARGGHVDVVRCLLRDSRINANRVDQAGLTALMHAINGNHDEIARILLEAGADPTIRDENQQTALSRAIKNKNEALQALLRQAGASE